MSGDAIAPPDPTEIDETLSMELVHNIARWLANMKKRPGYPKTYEVFMGFADSLKGQQFQRI